MEKIEQTIGGDTENKKVILADNHYNELGQLMLKKLHSANDTSFVQDIDYLYDVRGWLTQINNFEYTTQNKLYAQSFAYNANGNISNINWKNTLLNNDGWVDPTNKLSYAFSYDGLNRLTGGNYGEHTPAGLPVNGGNFDVGFGYDLNGNITSLSKKRQCK